MLRLGSSILVVLVLTACAGRLPGPEPLDDGKYLFVCPAAKGKVYLVGDFNHWRRQAMKKRNGRAELAVRLKPGAYAYACAYAGGRIVEPPGAPAYVADAFGGRNGYLVVPATEGSDRR